MKDIIATLESYTIANEFLGFRNRKQKKLQREEEQKERNMLDKAISKYDPMLKSAFNAYANQCKAVMQRIWPEIVNRMGTMRLSTSHSYIFEYNKIAEGKYRVEFNYGLLYVDDKGLDLDDISEEKMYLADKLEKLPIKVPSGLKGAKIKAEANPDEYVGIVWMVDMIINVDTAAEESIFDI